MAGKSSEKPVRIYQVGVYARLSVDSGDRKNESIETQVEIVKAFVAERDDMEIYEVYTDLGKTGVSFEREGFERMMCDVRARRIDCIIVKDLSRFGRNHIETGNYLERIFPFMGVRFIAVTDNFDSMDRQGQGGGLNVNLKNLINEMYARDIAVKVKAGKRARWEQGSYTGGIPPYGYRAEWIDGRKRLLIEKGTSDIVKKIYEMFLSGSSRKEIVVWLFENKVTRPTEYHGTGKVFCGDGQGLLQWPEATVKLILTNPVYMGCLVQGCACGKDYMMRGRQDIDSGDWSVKKHTHEAIVSEETFFEAAGKFKKSCDKKRFAKIPAEEDIFAGILYCGDCGAEMKRTGRESRSPDRAGAYRYQCPRSGRIDSLKCGEKSITFCSLRDIAAKTIRQEFILSGMGTKDLVERSVREAEAVKGEWERRLAALDRKLESMAILGSGQYRRYRMGEMEEGEFKRAREENEKSAALVREESRAIAEKLKEIDSETSRRSHLLRTLMKGREKGELPPEIIRTLIKRIEVYAERRVKITFTFGESKVLTGAEKI